MKKTAFIISNLGTPDSPEVKDVEKYLLEFLSDPLVVDLPKIIRNIIFPYIVIPRRAPKSAHNYKTVWTPEGSPLMVHSKRLLPKLKVGKTYLAMRYGNPSLESAILAALEDEPEQIVLAPLYPQFADATTGSTILKTKELLTKAKFKGELKILSPFFEQDFFLDPIVAAIKNLKSPAHILFSFHGLPVKQNKKNCKICVSEPQCTRENIAFSSGCYQSQCYQTARIIAGKLGLDSTQWTISFQSRFGPVAWLQPYTEAKLRELPAQGIKNLVVVAPSFVADCLETIEELGIRGKELFLLSGGEQIHVLECVNSNEEFAQGLSAELERMAT